MNHLLEILKKYQLVPVVTIEDAAAGPALAEALMRGGLSCMEVTFRTKAAGEAICRIKEKYPKMLVAAGTVLTKEQADEAITAGADFLVSPGLNPETIRYVQSRGAVMIPGCATPSDMEAALALGITLVKFFPAEAMGGLPLIKAMAAPYSMLHFMPTGGICEDNVCEYLAFPKVAACGGSWMVKPEWIKTGNYDEIEKATKRAVERIASL